MVFDTCLKLGIDDPVAWMEYVDSKIVDLWIAHSIVSRKREFEDRGTSDPEALQNHIEKAFAK